jgi:histidine ammonia-lyase
MGHVLKEEAFNPTRSRHGNDEESAFEKLGFGFHYAAASRLGAIRLLANPVSLDVPPLDYDIEDHATNAPYAVSVTADCVAYLREIVIAELLITFRSLKPHQRAGLGAETAEIADTLEEIIGGLPDGATSADAHKATILALRVFLADQEAGRGVIPAAVP